MKIVLVHDFPIQIGAEISKFLCKYFPQVNIFTSIYEIEQTIGSTSITRLLVSN